MKEGYILDYISGEEVKATPEEIEAVQIFSQSLVEDYGYKKSQIQTRPQWRVKMRPSDSRKEYPIDIAIFNCSDEDGGGGRMKAIYISLLNAKERRAKMDLIN